MMFTNLKKGYTGSNRKSANLQVVQLALNETYRNPGWEHMDHKLMRLTIIRIEAEMRIAGTLQNKTEPKAKPQAKARATPPRSVTSGPGTISRTTRRRGMTGLEDSIASARTFGMAGDAMLVLKKNHLKRCENGLKNIFASALPCDVFLPP